MAPYIGAILFRKALQGNTKEGNFMIEENVGWIVSMWTDSSQIKPNDKSELPYLSWSPYDRVTIDKIENFSGFFQTKDFQNWNGTVQRLHLLPMTACQWESGKESLISTRDSKEQMQGIYCIVTARFTYRFQDVNNIEDSVQNKIFEYLEDRKVQWQCFRSLGAEDFVGIFLANTIKELEEVVYFLKELSCRCNSKKVRVFNSVYSFMGLNRMNYDEEPKAELLVRLHWKSDYSRKEVREQLEKKLKEHFQDNFAGIIFRNVTSGRGYIEVVIPNRKGIFSCFHNEPDAIFNGESNFYKKYIESSRTYWYSSENNEVSIEEDIGSVETCKEDEFKPINFENSEIHPVSQFILKEYEKMINSHRCLWWRPILLNQYKMYAAFVQEYTETGNQVSLCRLNNKVQTVLLHINQATAPIYEVPYNNYYYSGSYNDVLRMYYGIIAAVFNLAYKLPRDENTTQHEIVYCVDFEEATKVHSSMYTLKRDSKRFVIFHLPYDAFMQFDKTIKLLLHEIYHYVAPYNRVKRNFVFIETLIFSVFEQYISFLTACGLKEESEREITQYFHEEYKTICEIVQMQLGNELNGKILNDFTARNKLCKLRHIPEKICEVICSKMDEEAGLWLKEVKLYCSYQKMYPKLFEPKVYDYLFETVRRIALASKEAFCDINMIGTLKLNLAEYFELLYNALFSDYESTRVNELLVRLGMKENMKISSYELRIGMVLDWYYGQRADSQFKQYGDELRQDIHNIEETAKDAPLPKSFYQYLLESYDKYLDLYNTQRYLFKNLFNEEQQWISVYEKDVQRNCLCNAVAKPNNISNNITIIHDFINVMIDQKNLNRNKRRQQKIICSGINSELKRDRIVICNLGQYVEKCCQIVHDWGENLVWYRGVCDETFSLLPSLIRNPKANMSLYTNQARLLQAAYYATISEKHLWLEQQGTVLEQMGILQHYGIPTSLLDFSEDMLMALHFALNPDNKTDLEKVEQYIFQPIVVLFSPSRYNRAVISMKKGRLIEGNMDATSVLLDIQEEMVKEYCVHDISEEYLNKMKVTLETYDPNPYNMKYPRPIAIRRTNARIQAQKGTFLAYNLHACPENKDEQGVGNYSYLDLRKIQERYFQSFHDEGKRNTGMFMKEIYINKQNIPMIKKQLQTMNITTAHAYPELFRIFAEYMEKENRSD